VRIERPMTEALTGGAVLCQGRRMDKAPAETAVLWTLVLCGIVPFLFLLWIVIHF
jgi:hypothetical protein